jgi:hypothetical protein
MSNQKQALLCEVCTINECDPDSRQCATCRERSERMTREIAARLAAKKEGTN